MCLVRKLELSLHIVQVLLIFLNSLLFILLSFFTSLLWRLDLLQEIVMSLKELLCVNLANLTERNIWNFVFETTMDVHVVA